MSRTLPLRPSIDHTPRSRLVIDLASEESAASLDALASDTARAVVRTLADDPATASDLADAVDTSLQNAQYHLAALREAGLVVDAGTWYSSRGKEMTVYAPATERLELHVSAAGDRSTSGSDRPERGSTGTDRLATRDVPALD